MLVQTLGLFRQALIVGTSVRAAVTAAGSCTNAVARPGGHPRPPPARVAGTAACQWRLFSSSEAAEGRDGNGRPLPPDYSLVLDKSKHVAEELATRLPDTEVVAIDLFFRGLFLSGWTCRTC